MKNGFREATLAPDVYEDQLFSLQVGSVVHHNGEVERALLVKVMPGLLVCKRYFLNECVVGGFSH